ncbi:HalX domain-containing protein [Halorarius halobius]|uniref:HalX domain-containing protein n=1 Tax=Halorarius halobius TaxID=2962671 RepID=UPI0020CE9818|nr:HalX domain-containing protein [Halorarius halobius]
MTGANPGILVVDEKDGLARLYRTWLNEAGYSAEWTTSTDPATWSKPTEYDVLVVGQAVDAQFGRERPPARTVLVVTNPGLELVAVPADEYLLTPVSKPGLRSVVERVLRREEYDRPVGDLAGAVGQVVTIRGHTSVRARADSEPYRSLLGRVLALRATLDATIADLSDEEVRAVFGDGERAKFARTPMDEIDIDVSTSDSE